MNTKQAEATSFVITKKFIQTLMAGALVALCIWPAQAAVSPGDQFTSTFTEISPNPETATVTFTVGTPAGPGFFNLSSFSFPYPLCYTCPKGVGDMLLNGTTLELQGHISGLVYDGRDLNHWVDLALSPLESPGTWALIDDRLLDRATTVSFGTFTRPVSVIPEPSVWIMLSLGLLAIAYREQLSPRASDSHRT